MPCRMAAMLRRGAVALGGLLLWLATMADAQPTAPEATLIGGTIAQSGPMSVEVGPFKKMTPGGSV